MWLQGSRAQQAQANLYRADITLSGSAQLVLGRSMSRSQLILQNLGTHAMAIEIGSARGTCSLSSGTVSSVSITNGGFNFTKPPLVRFLGGGQGNSGTINTSYVGLAQPNGWTPTTQATGIAVLSGGAVASVTITNPGSGYIVAPYVLFLNSDLDPNGCATPTVGSVGMQLPANQAVPVAWNGTACPTDSISVIGTGGDVLFCGWME